MEDFESLGFTKKKEIQIRAHDEDLKGVYSNFMQIQNTQEEFVLDFFLVIPRGVIPAQGTIVSRVILHPAHFKSMVQDVFMISLKKYEEKFGEIIEKKND